MTREEYIKDFLLKDKEKALSILKTLKTFKIIASIFFIIGTIIIAKMFVLEEFYNQKSSDAIFNFLLSIDGIILFCDFFWKIYLSDLLNLNKSENLFDSFYFSEHEKRLKIVAGLILPPNDEPSLTMKEQKERNASFWKKTLKLFFILFFVVLFLVFFLVIILN